MQYVVPVVTHWPGTTIALNVGGAVIPTVLMNLDKIRGLAAPVASIGGAGTFDGIFLTGIVAALLT